MPMQICKFAFKGGRVHFQNKYVRTEAMTKEQAAGKMLYRGAFSVGNPSGGKFFNPFNFAVKGIANTGVLNWGDRLLALYEVSSQLHNSVIHMVTTAGRHLLSWQTAPGMPMSFCAPLSCCTSSMYASTADYYHIHDA